MWRYTPFVPALGRKRLSEFEACLVYLASSRKPSLGSKGNNKKQKVGEDDIELGGRVPVTAISRTWLLWTHGSTFTVKDRRNRLWNLPLLLRKASAGRHVSEVSLNGGLKRAFCKAVKLKAVLPWRPQDVRDAIAMGNLVSRTASKEGKPPKRKKCVAVIKAKQSCPFERILTSNKEIQSFEFA